MKRVVALKDKSFAQIQNDSNKKGISAMKIGTVDFIERSLGIET